MASGTFVLETDDRNRLALRLIPSGDYEGHLLRLDGAMVQQSIVTAPWDKAQLVETTLVLVPFATTPPPLPQDVALPVGHQLVRPEHLSGPGIRALLKAAGLADLPASADRASLLAAVAPLFA